MATAPPLARDRLVGLVDLPPGFVKSLEDDQRLPPRMALKTLTRTLIKIRNTIEQLADRDLFPWLDEDCEPTEHEAYRASTIIADRLCAALANPIIRNAQEKRQLDAIQRWLEPPRYRQVKGATFDKMPPGTFSFRTNVAVTEGSRSINIPIDTVITPRNSRPGDYPLLVEAKSAGDFANTNKRRKEEAQKVNQLRRTYGKGIRFILFLCGYINRGYLEYEAAEEIDWVWEHRADDLEGFGL